MVNGIGSREVLENLYRKYYGDLPDARDLEFVSSDWKMVTEDFDVLQSPDGLVKPLGEDFWGCNVGSLGNRLLDYACNVSYLARLRNRKELIVLMNKYSQIIRKLGLATTYTVFRYICTLALLKLYIKEQLNDREIKVLSIGDGIGVLSVLIKAELPECKIVMVDLGKTLIYQAYYMGLAYPGSVHELILGDNQRSGGDIIYCPTESLESLNGMKFNLAININSMQEMNSNTVIRYFDFLRQNFESQNLFYCCNRTSRVMVGGEVSKFADYPWASGDLHLIDGECPWQRYFMARYPAKNGPRLLGKRIPLLSYYDGTIKHRLSTLETV